MKKALILLIKVDTPVPNMVVVDKRNNTAWKLEGPNEYGPESWDVRLSATRVGCLPPNAIYRMLANTDDNVYVPVTNIKDVEKILDDKMVGKEVEGNVVADMVNGFYFQLPEAKLLTPEEVLAKHIVYFPVVPLWEEVTDETIKTKVYLAMEEYANQFK